jgi:hypothetical protein
MVSRDAFIGVYMMSNTRQRASSSRASSQRSFIDTGFMGGRDNGPAMTRFGNAGMITKLVHDASGHAAWISTV